MNTNRVSEKRPPVQEDAITRVARCIFAYRWPRATWDDPLWHAERDDALFLAVQLRQMFVQPWTVGTALDRLTDEFLHLLFGARPVNSGQRGAVKAYAESCLEDLWPLFSGDNANRPAAPTTEVM